MTTVDAVFLTCAGDLQSPSSMFEVQMVQVKSENGRIRLSRQRKANMGSNWVHPILHQAECDHWNWSERDTAGKTGSQMPLAPA
jgi:hypothetical protein